MLMVINSVISRWIYFVIKQEMKAASPVTEVKFNPETPNPGFFQIYGSVDRYKILPGPFYRLLGLFHLILLFPTSVLLVGFVWQFYPRKTSPSAGQTKQCIYPAWGMKDSEVRRIKCSLAGLTKVNVLTESRRACLRLCVDSQRSSQAIAKGVLPL